MADVISPVNNQINNQSSVVAKFGEEYTILEYNDSDGTRKTKRVDTAEFCKRLGNKSVSYSNYFPPGCRGFGVKGTNTQAYLLVYGPQRHKSFLDWNGKGDSYRENIPTDAECQAAGIATNRKSRYRVFDVPYPPLAFMLRINVNSNSNNRMSYTLGDQYVWAIKDPNADPSVMQLFRYPFTNIFPEGRCCLGHDYTSTVNSLNGILYFPTLVFNGIGNFDLTCTRGEHFDNEDHEHKPFGFIKSEHDLMAKLHGAEHFPLEYLLKEDSTAEFRFNNLLNSTCY